MSLHLTADLELLKERFIRRVRDHGEVWGLRSEARGWAYCPSNDGDEDVLVFWSDRAYAARHAVDEWADYVPTVIPLEAFMQRWLPGMQRDGALAGVNFNADLAGVELRPEALLEALR